jgi:hypothetical protein
MDQRALPSSAIYHQVRRTYNCEAEKVNKPAEDHLQNQIERTLRRNHSSSTVLLDIVGAKYGTHHKLSKQQNKVKESKKDEGREMRV